MVTRGTRAGAFVIGDQFLCPGVGLFEVESITGAVGSESGAGIILMKVRPIGRKVNPAIENVWFHHETILHKVI